MPETLHPNVTRHRPHDLSTAGGVITEMGWCYRARLKGWIERQDLSRNIYALSHILRGIQIQEQLSLAAKGGAMPFQGLVIAGPPATPVEARPKADGPADGKVVEAEAREVGDA